MLRIQLELPEEQVAALDRLSEDLGIRTRKELFNNALTLLDWAVQERKAGRFIASVDDDQTRLREILLPVLQAIKPEQELAVKS
jgi:metal-responsive CopG/Arc/MetJ family transcriptional regulator